MSEADDFTTERHAGTVGSTAPALCGALPPNGRAWKAAPEGLPECEKCREELRMRSQMWMAS